MGLKRRLAIIGLGVGTCLASLLLVELLLSSINFKVTDFLFKDSLDSPRLARFFIVDDQTIVRLTDLPNNKVVFGKSSSDAHWAVDESGFRPDNRNNQERADFTILMAGDSFTYSDGATHTEAYPSVLEKNLLDKGFDVNVVNAGVPGFGPDQVYNQLERLVPKVKPDLVIWNIYQNDLTDANYYCLYDLDKSNRLRSLPIWHNNVYRQGVLVDRLPLAWFKFRVTHLLLATLGYPIGSDGLTQIATTGCTQPLTKDLKLKLQQKVGLFLEQTKNQLEAKGIKMLVVNIPYQHAFFAEKEPDRYGDEHENNKLLESAITDHHLSFCNAGLSFKQMKQDEVVGTTWFHSDAVEPRYIKHLNAKGYEELAKTVEQCLYDREDLKAASSAAVVQFQLQQ